LLTVSLGYDKFDTLNLIVKERESNYFGAFGTPGVDKDCYFIDPTGLVFAKAPQFSGNVFFEIYGKPVATPIGSHPISAPELTLITNVYNRLQSALKTTLLKDDKPIRMFQEEAGDYTIIVTHKGVKSDVPSEWQLKFNKNVDVNDLMVNFASVITAPTFAAQLNSS
jgi:hypothetical protein